MVIIRVNMIGFLENILIKALLFITIKIYIIQYMMDFKGNEKIGLRGVYYTTRKPFWCILGIIK